ncbi:alsin homolog [Phlebotomus argentipes]|uniref:alsin homolog n=1 Tax=Phlebotomus argentipes TaxID=94469 RepID=UPI0028935044|nr:alsin homolog [Phlebotomus argentipes]
MFFTLHDGGTPVRVEYGSGREYALRLCAVKNRVCVLTSKLELLCGDLEDNSRLSVRLVKANVVDVDSDGSEIFIVDTSGVVWSSKWSAIEKEELTWHEIPVPNPRTCPHGMRNVNESIRVVAVNCNQDGVLFTTCNRELFAMGDFGEIANCDIPVLVECFRGLRILQVSTGENFAVVLTHKRLHTEHGGQDNVSVASDASEGFLCVDCPKCVPDINHHLTVHGKAGCGISKSTTETSMASSPCLSDTFDAVDDLASSGVAEETHKSSVAHLKIHKDAAINFLLDLSLSSEDYLIEAGKQTKLLKENVTNITTMVYEGVRTLSRHMSGSDNNDTVVEETNPTAGALVNGETSVSETSSIDLGSTVDLHSESGTEGRVAKLARLGGALLATEVWCFGSINRGQLGTGDHIKRARINAVLGLGGQGVVRIDSGKEHSLALTLDGRLYLWGNNLHKQISREDVEDFSFPRRFQLLSDCNVLAAACGSQHSSVVMNDLTVHEQSDHQEDNKTCGVSPFTPTARDIVDSDPPPGSVEPVLASGSFTLFNHMVFGAIAKHLTAEQKFLQDSLVAYNCLLKPFLKRISNIAYSQIFDGLCQNYLSIVHVAALNVRSLLEFGHGRITCTDIVALNNCQEMIVMYRSYTKRFCDVMCIRGFPTIEMLTEKSSKDIHKIFFRPFRRIWAFIDMIYDLVALEPVEANRELLDERRAMWEKFSNEKDLAIEEAERSLRFWEVNQKSALAKLQSPDRRLILDSKELSLKRSQTARFSNQWFILFSDSLCSMSGHLNVYPLKTLWIASIADGETRKFALKIVTPEETLILCAQNHENKLMWLDGIESGIRNCLGRVPKSKVPQYRNASYTFSEKHPRFPGAKYFGRWYVGSMHGIGHLEMADGRVFNGQMSAGEIHGYGRMFTPSVGIYEGDFEHGKYCGYGVLEHQNKATYEGNFRDGVYHGHGTLITDQFTYVGEFSGGSKHGYGVLDDNMSGDKYMGMFVDGKRAGLGVCVTMCGDYFEGSFINDALAGEGVASFENNSYYEGEMTLFGPNGRGSFFVGVSERKNSDCRIDSDGDLREIEGSVLAGSLSGTWADVKISNGTLAMHQIFRKYSKLLGKYTVENEKKWRSLFDDWEAQLLGSGKNLDNKQIWSKIAIFITNAKAKDKLKSEGFASKNICFYHKTDLSGSLDRLSIRSGTGSSKKGPLDLGDVFHPLTMGKPVGNSTIMDLGAFSQKLEEKFEALDCVSRSSSVRSKNPTLEYIPNFGITKCDPDDLPAVTEYLKEAFKDLNHPLGVLNSKISHCFYSSYGCWKFKPTAILHRHAMQEWESICRRIHSVICRMFPALPDSGASFRSLLYPILLSEGIYSLLFVLYASKCSHRDEMYRQRMIGCDRKTDQELALFLRVDTDLMPLVKSSYFEDAIGCLKQVKDKYCPLEMVSLIEKTFQLLEDAKTESVGASLTLNADNTIPLVLLLVLRANIQHLGAELALLEDLLGGDFEALMLGYTGYCITTLKAAYQHILSDKFYQN